MYLTYTVYTMDIDGNGMILQVGGPHLLRGPATNLRSDGQVAAFPRRDNDQLKRSTLEVVTWRLELEDLS